MSLGKLALPVTAAAIALSCVQAAGIDVEPGVVVPFNSRTGHPAILLAWRNTQKIFEAEVLVQNQFDVAKNVGVRLEVVDDDGRVLMSRPGPTELSQLTLPGRQYGGAEGAIVQVRGSREANLIIDLLDRQRQPYHVRASVFEHMDAAPRLVEVATRSLHGATFVHPGSEFLRNFQIRNDSGKQLTYDINVVRHGFDFGSISLCPRVEPSRQVALEPNETLHCFVRLATGNRFERDQVSDIIVDWTGRDKARNLVLRDSREWFVSNDESVPEVKDLRKVLGADGSIRLEALVASGSSGIEEASGVRIEYSVDDGITFSNRVMAYLDGNFHDPTRFLATIGPFRQGTTVSLWLTVTNGAGITSRLDLGNIHI